MNKTQKKQLEQVIAIPAIVAEFPVGIPCPVETVIEPVNETSDETPEIVDVLASFRAHVKTLTVSKQSRLAAEIRETFIELMGLPKAVNKTGYKQGETADDSLLEQIIETRDKYEVICCETGKYWNILDKMDRNLNNSDRASKFAAIARQNAKKKEAVAA